MAAYVDSKYSIFQQRDFTGGLPNKQFTKNVLSTRTESRLHNCVGNFHIHGGNINQVLRQ